MSELPNFPDASDALELEEEALKTSKAVREMSVDRLGSEHASLTRGRFALSSWILGFGVLRDLSLYILILILKATPPGF